MLMLTFVGIVTLLLIAWVILIPLNWMGVVYIPKKIMLAPLALIVIFLGWIIVLSLGVVVLILALVASI